MGLERIVFLVRIALVRRRRYGCGTMLVQAR
jgi:hypothetical protein